MNVKETITELGYVEYKTEGPGHCMTLEGKVIGWHPFRLRVPNKPVGFKKELGA